MWKDGEKTGRDMVSSKDDLSLPKPKHWFCSVMVITLDSDSNDPGSIPGRT